MASIASTSTCSGPLHVLTFLLFALIVSGVNGVETRRLEEKDTCTAAIAAHSFAVSAIQAATTGTDPTNDAVSAELVSLIAEAYVKQHPVKRSKNLLDVLKDTPYAAWGDTVVQTAIANNVQLPSAQLGEIMYIVNTFLESVANVSVPVEDYGDSEYQAWTKVWTEYGDRLYNKSKTMSDSISRRGLLFRAMNYHVSGWFPQPHSEGVVEGIKRVQKIFKEAIALFTAYEVIPFSVNYDNGTAVAELSGYFLTPSPKVKRPLIIFAASPHGLKEFAFIRFGPAALRRDYAFVVFDAPGQGLVVREPPQMVVQPDSAKVFKVVLDHLIENDRINESFDTEQVIILGNSVGSFAAAQACSKMSDRLAACIFNPGVTTLAAAFNSVVLNLVYLPIQRASLNNTSLLPSEMQPLFEDPLNKILLPILFDCSEDSDAPSLFGQPFSSGRLSPEVHHAVLEYVGVYSQDHKQIIDSVWFAYRYMNEYLSNVSAEAITVPVFMTTGLDDNYLGSQAQTLFNRLPPETQNVSKLIIYDAESGGAMHAQAGSFALFDEDAFPWLAETLETPEPPTTNTAGR